MKKFTSLFALLAGLCVFNAQADKTVTIYVNASNPSNQHLYWWNTKQGTGIEWAQAPKISTLPSENINGVTFYYKELTITDEGAACIKFLENEPSDRNPQTGDITGLSAEKYYYNYNGSDQYSVPVITLGISSSVDDWNSVNPEFDYTGNNTWTCTWDLSDVTENVNFKLRPNLVYYAGYADNTIEAASGWTEGSDNITLKHSTTGCKKYQITASWNTNTFTEKGWTINIKGILEINDGSAFSATNSFTASSATYSRTSSYEWGTLCLPFEIKKSYDGVTFYSLSAVDETNKVLTFSPKEEAISAGEPVVYKSTSKSLNISENEVYVSPIVNEVSEVDGWTLYGSFVAMSNVNPESGKYLYYIANDQFYKSKENANVPAYRAYFIANVNLVDNNSPAPIRIDVADSEDIQFVEQEDGTVKAYYDLQGRKLDSARKGLVIENGKIIMVK